MAEFTPNAARRVAKATRYVEKARRNERGHRGRWLRTEASWEIAELTSQLSFEGSATAQIQKWDSAAEEWTDDTSRSVVTVWDAFLLSGETVASGKRVKIDKHRQGIWVVTAAQCPS